MKTFVLHGTFDKVPYLLQSHDINDQVQGLGTRAADSRTIMMTVAPVQSFNLTKCFKLSQGKRWDPEKEMEIFRQT